MTQSKFSRAESGNRNLHVDELLRIAEVLDVDPSLLYREEPITIRKVEIT